MNAAHVHGFQVSEYACQLNRSMQHHLLKIFSLKVVFMTQGKRFGLSAAQKRDVWRRWKAGDSLHKIGRAFGKEHSSIRCLVSRHGGFVPAVRQRSLAVRRFAR
jgi:hypothetical protein